MGKNNFKDRHLRSTTTDKGGKEVINHTIQVGPSSFVTDKDPPDGGFCDNCGVAIDPRHFQSLVDKLATSGLTILNLQKKLAEYEGDADELEADQLGAEGAEELAHLDDEADEVGMPDPEPRAWWK